MDNEATKRDLINIMKISAGFDGHNRQILLKIMQISETTSHFKSPLGQAFVKRTKELLQDQQQKKGCLICKKQVAENGFVCQNCIQLYKTQVAKKQAPDTSAVKQPSQTPPVNTAPQKKELVSHTLSETTCTKTNLIYGLTGSIRKKVLKKKLQRNPDYQIPQSDHQLATLFTIFVLISYLFTLYAGAFVLIIGLAIAAFTIIQKLRKFKADGIFLIILSILFLPVGAILSLFGIISKMGYLYKNQKFIRAGFWIYGTTAFICASLYDIPGHYCDPGIVGYYDMVVRHDYGTRWSHSVTAALLEMLFFVLSALVFTYFVSGAASLYMDEVEVYYKKQNLSTWQIILKCLQAPIETLLIFLPLILFVFCIGESLEGGWEIGDMTDDALDIDNGTHHVSSYTRIRNGKIETVRSSIRRNPDDIINNNFSYRGDSPYDGTNPIPNNHVHRSH